MNDSIGDDVSKVFDFTCGEVAFFEFAILLVVSEARDNMVYVAVVIFDGGGIDEDIIEIHDDKTIKPIIEECVHCSLKGYRGVGETERHNNELVCTIARCKRCIVFIAEIDGDLMVSTIQVKFGELTGMDKAVMKIIDTW